MKAERHSWSYFQHNRKFIDNNNSLILRLVIYDSNKFSTFAVHISTIQDIGIAINYKRCHWSYQWMSVAEFIN